MKKLPVEAELILVEGRTDKHDEANTSFFEILRTPLKTEQRLN
jgi:hypothetical protein